MTRGLIFGDVKPTSTTSTMETTDLKPSKHNKNFSDMKASIEQAEKNLANFKIYFEANQHLLRAMPKAIAQMHRSGLGGFGFNDVLTWLRCHRDYRGVRMGIEKENGAFTIPKVFHSFFLHALLIYEPELRHEFEILESQGKEFRPQIRAMLIRLGFVKEISEVEMKKILKVNPPMLFEIPRQRFEMISMDGVVDPTVE